MVYKQIRDIITPLLLIIALFLSGCAQAFQPVTTNEIVTTPVTTDSTDAVDNPDIFADPAKFLPILLDALTTHDTGRLQQWMTNPFLESTWRFNQSEISPDEAIYFLYADQLGTENKLELVKDADLKSLMGIDPLSIPGSESGVMYPFLISGWGKDGRDEAILFITKEPADELKWHGWMQIKGGFSGARIGGIQAYTDDALGFSVFLPKDYEVIHPSDSEVMFLAPGEGHPSENRAAATIFVEPANGRTAEQVATAIAEDNKSVMGPGYTGGDITVMEIDGEPAYSVGGLTGQDINRRVYMVHNDLLYWMMFVPDNPQAAAYLQMEDVYAMIVNTFQYSHTYAPTSTTLTPLLPTWTVTPVGASNLEIARHTLLTFFTLLHDGRYSEAVPLYGGTYDYMRSNNPLIPLNDFAALFESSCTNQRPCLSVANVVEETKVSEDEYKFIIEFMWIDGTLFKLGPCCGATETEMPPVWQFPYTVKIIDGQFKVMEEPVYMP